MTIPTLRRLQWRAAPWTKISCRWRNAAHGFSEQSDTARMGDLLREKRVPPMLVGTDTMSRRCVTNNDIAQAL